MSEVAVVDKSAIALAADGIATTDLTGIHTERNGLNKLFSLSVSQPVGVMISGSPTLMGVPWEAVIELYRKHLIGKT